MMKERNDERDLQNYEATDNTKKAINMKEETNMSFDPKPVTLEEYNQSLRDAVNAYYTHSINDPSMSREEALKSTGEMSEKYLGAVEDFQNAQNTQMGNETENNAGGVQNFVDNATTGAMIDNGTETTGNVGMSSENAADSSIGSESAEAGDGCECGMDA